MARLSREDRMTIQSLAHHGQSNRAVARLLGVSEGAVRYHRRRAEGAADGRGEQAFTADGYHRSDRRLARGVRATNTGQRGRTARLAGGGT